MQPGTVTGGGKTIVGDENLLMAYVHVAHDCLIGNHNVLANGTQLAGHVTIQNMAVLGGLSAVHQFTMIGDMAIISGGARVKKDTPPYCVVDGFQAVLRGLNTIALQRRNVSLEARVAIKNAYKIIFLDGHATIQEAIAQISMQDLSYFEVQNFVTFIQNSKRGVLRPLSSSKNGELGDEY
jgi:UDP-N-acetylglucosamine acyltransferase